MGFVGVVTVVGHFSFASIVIALVTHFLSVLFLVSVWAVEFTDVLFLRGHLTL